MEKVRALIREVKDFPAPGVVFRDITPVFKSWRNFSTLIFAMSYHVTWENVIIGIDARGFILGSTLAHHMRLSMVPVRKKGKLPPPVWSESCMLEYGSEVFEIQKDALSEESCAIVVDDVLATGGTAVAAIKLARMCGAKVNKCIFAVEIESLGGRKKIEDMGVDVVSIFIF